MNKSSELYLFDELFRQKGFSALCGIDEAGRGPLAGPVCAAAVDRKSTRLNSSHEIPSRMPSSA